MTVNHLCNDNCFAGRGSRNKLVKCIFCDNSFNLKCFNINIAVTKVYFELDSHILFVCYKCHPTMLKHRTSAVNNRRSVTASNYSGNRKSTSSSSKINATNNSSLNSNQLSQTQILNKILNKLNDMTSSQSHSQQQQTSNTPDTHTQQQQPSNTPDTHTQSQSHQSTSFDPQTIIDTQTILQSKTLQNIESVINNKLDAFKNSVGALMIDYNKI